MIKVFIDGKEGTTGLRIFERFSKRDDIEVLQIEEALRKDEVARANLMNQADYVFLCLPDQAAIEATKLVTNPNVTIIDASTAHRTNPSWDYGFPELSKKHFEGVKNSKRVAVPGCHASGVISLIYPLVDLGIAPVDYPFSAFSLTGYSGGGKKMIKQYEEEKTKELFSPRVYGLAQAHKHLPEIKYVCNLNSNITFSPIVDDYYSGMVVSVPLNIKALNITLKELHEKFSSFYANQELIKVMPLLEKGTPDGFMGSNNLSGLDYMEVYVCGNDENATLISRFDNLGKGASGAAIECLNIMMGLNPGYGLER